MRLTPFLVIGLLALAPPSLAQRAESPSGIEPAARLSPAQIRSDALDRLFAQLHKASTKEASRIEQNIWKTWMVSDSPSADLVLEQAAKAMEQQRYVPAIDMLTTLIDLYPTYAEAWNKRATIFFIIGRNQESLADIDKVLELEPRHFGALSGRGMIYEKEKNIPAAIEAYRNALKVNPKMQSVIDALERLEDEAQPI